MNPIVGRESEQSKITACLKTGRNLLLEGPVGVGKTTLALAILGKQGKSHYRVDGDHRYTENKMTGWFDPPLVLKKGYVDAAFIPGPLIRAMKEGVPLFINELNRLPEAVQNVLLPAIDEKIIEVPKVGRIQAKDGFQVIATQNPKEFVATSHLSEALLDRFEWLYLDYQSEAEEKAILLSKVKIDEALASRIVKTIRLTRHHDSIRRGASVRAALSVGDIFLALDEKNEEERLFQAMLMGLPTRLEIEAGIDCQDLIRELLAESQKKK